MSRYAALVAVLLLLGAVLPGSGAAAQQRSAAAARPQVETDLRVERRLLSLDVLAYRQAREREGRSRDRVAEVSRRLDAALAAERVSLAALEALREELAVARAVARADAEEMEAGLARISQQLRRIGVLEEELRGAPAVADPISGRWRARFEPGGLTGVFELSLERPRVTGSYQVDGEGGGPLQGTYAGGILRLERIEPLGGSDRVFWGDVEAAAGRITGTWQDDELAQGRPVFGSWTAVRIDGPESER